MLNALKNIVFFNRNEYIYSKKPYIFTIYNSHKKYLELVKKNDKKVTLVSISEFDIFAVRHDVPVIDSYEFQSDEPWEKSTIVPVSDSDLTVIN